MPNFRVYRLEVIEMHPDVTFILLVPAPNEVCSAPGQSLVLCDERRGCFPLPVPTFELIHLCTYQPEFVTLYCRLAAQLELLVLAAQHLHRQAFSETETSSSRQCLDQLLNFQAKLDRVWQAVRWVNDIVTAARDRSNNCGIPLGTLHSYSNPAGPSKAPETGSPKAPTDRDSNGSSEEAGEDNSDVGYHSDQSIDKLASAGGLKLLPSTSSASPQPLQNTANNPTYDCLLQPRCRTSYLQARSPFSQKLANFTLQMPVEIPAPGPTGPTVGPVPVLVRPIVRYGSQNSMSSGSESTISGRSMPCTTSDTELINKVLTRPKIRMVQPAQGINEDLSLIDQLYCSSQPTESSSQSVPARVQFNPKPPPAPARTPDSGSIIRVYAAYDTGLAKGTSVKLQVTQKSTAREVINLVIQQLNQAVQARNLSGPVYGLEEWLDFCLVAVIGSRERCLRDDFCPLQLQNPWQKGRLFVRKKNDLLAALEYGNSAIV